MKKPEQMQALGEFVREHRRQIPAPAGATRARRTPGLRREELAVKASISVTWCAWIEQGRIAGVSPKALSRLARALELSDADRATFFELSGKSDPEMDGAPSFSMAPEGLADLVDAIANPAYALDSGWSASCWNAPASELFPGWLGDDCDRNLLRYVFLNREARAVAVDWPQWAQHLVEQFRAHVGDRLDDPVMRELVYSLSRASTAFCHYWDGGLDEKAEGGFLSFAGSGRPAADYLQTRWRPPEYPDFIVVIHTPAAQPAAGGRRVLRG